MSYWSSPKPQLRTRAIDIDSLARITIEILGTSGLRGLTLREVARRLEVAAPSLYSRIDSLDDLLDLALDYALKDDPAINQALRSADLTELLLQHYRHLCNHPWACQVLAMRPPRGPSYLALAEQICTLLDEYGATDPLGTAYGLSNLVIGSATTQSAAKADPGAAVTPALAPRYSALHNSYNSTPEQVLKGAIAAQLRYSNVASGQ